MNIPKISVVIPLYNKEEHILDTLNSIYEQSVQPDEVIVIDDGSTDNGVALAQQSGHKNLRVICQKNQGVSVARNNGVSLAKNDYVAFLDADDVWLPFYLEQMIALIKKYPKAGMYASKYQCVTQAGEYSDAKIVMQSIHPEGGLIDNYFEIAAEGDLPFMMSSTLVHKSVFEKVGGFPAGEAMGEDQDFFAKIALQLPIAYSPNINLLYSLDAQNKATVNNIPSKECPYSQRLNTLVQSRNMDSKTSKAKSIMRYCAAHLCYLAKLNIQAGKVAEAKALLADPRCDLKPMHKIGLYVIAVSQQLMNLIIPTH